MSEFEEKFSSWFQQNQAGVRPERSLVARGEGRTQPGHHETVQPVTQQTQPGKKTIVKLIKHEENRKGNKQNIQTP